MLRPAGDLGLDLHLAELARQELGHAIDVLLALALALLHEARDLLEATRVQRVERQVLELPLDPVHAQAVRERCVDLERLGRLRLLLLAREHAQRAHVVQAVGELDQQDPDVPGHRDDHLADVLRLLLLAGAELDALELRQAVHDARHLRAELSLDVLEGQVRVLDDVVQERRLQGGEVHPEVREGDFNEVRRRFHSAAAG